VLKIGTPFSHYGRQYQKRDEEERMISSQTIQTSIDELKAITKVDLCVCDLSGSLVASTTGQLDLSADLITGFAGSPADSQVIGIHHLLKIMDEGELLYILVAKGLSEDVYMVGKIAVSQLQNLIIAYKERFDRNNFFQNLLLDNLLLVDIYNRAKKLHIEASVPRTVFLVETQMEKDGIVAELLKGMFSSHFGDYITAVDESNIILIKALEPEYTDESLMTLAETIVAMMNTEAMLNVRVSFGTVVQELKDVSKSYKEAKMALDVGKIFYAEKNTIAYSTLGIGRLIYQLPVNLCRLFIDEIFGENVPYNLDEETLTTINKFFENNLNVSETSRQLFVHRNTLVYRIEKIQKSTGLDLRNFDDALTFKIALMVVNYMRYRDSMDY
jgi:carbohydrate diacid regulator